MSFSTGTAVGGVVGLTAGLGLGSIITYIYKELEKNRILEEVGGVEAEKANEVARRFKPIIEVALKTIPSEFSEIQKEIKNAIALCYPVTEEKTHTSVPRLRQGNMGVDVLGVVSRHFQPFDGYYNDKQKRDGAIVDEAVAQVRILENIHYVLVTLINQVSEKPGPENKEILDALGAALKNVNANYLDLAQIRGVEQRNIIDKTARTKLAEHLIRITDDLISDAKRRQENVSLVRSHEYSIETMTEVAQAMNEFIFRSLSQQASKQKNKIEISNMRKGEYAVTHEKGKIARPGITEIISKRTSDLFNLYNPDVGKHAEASFDYCFEMGWFDVDVGNKFPTINKDDLPSFMQQSTISKIFGSSDSDPTRHGFSLPQISKALNYLNIAITMERDMRHKANALGYKGVFSTGEFEFRRSIINSFFDKSISEFMNVLTQNEYFKTLLLKHKHDEKLGANYVERMGFKVEKGAVTWESINADEKELLKWLDIHGDTRQVANTPFIKILRRLIAKKSEAKKNFDNIHAYVTSKNRSNDSLGQKIDLASTNTIVNLSIICAHDDEVYQSIKSDLNTKINSMSEGLKSITRDENYQSNYEAAAANIEACTSKKEALRIHTELFTNVKEKMNEFGSFNNEFTKSNSEFIKNKSMLLKTKFIYHGVSYPSGTDYNNLPLSFASLQKQADFLTIQRRISLLLGDINEEMAAQFKEAMELLSTVTNPNFTNITFKAFKEEISRIDAQSPSYDVDVSKQFVSFLNKPEVQKQLSALGGLSNEGKDKLEDMKIYFNQLISFHMDLSEIDKDLISCIDSFPRLTAAQRREQEIERLHFALDSMIVMYSGQLESQIQSIQSILKEHGESITDELKQRYTTQIENLQAQNASINNELKSHITDSSKQNDVQHEQRIKFLSDFDTKITASHQEQMRISTSLNADVSRALLNHKNDVDKRLIDMEAKLQVALNEQKQTEDSFKAQLKSIEEMKGEIERLRESSASLEENTSKLMNRNEAMIKFLRKLMRDLQDFEMDKIIDSSEAILKNEGTAITQTDIQNVTENVNQLKLFRSKLEISISEGTILLKGDIDAKLREEIRGNVKKNKEILKNITSKVSILESQIKTHQSEINRKNEIIIKNLEQSISDAKSASAELKEALDKNTKLHDENKKLLEAHISSLQRELSEQKNGEVANLLASKKHSYTTLHHIITSHASRLNEQITEYNTLKKKGEENAASEDFNPFAVGVEARSASTNPFDFADSTLSPSFSRIEITALTLPENITIDNYAENERKLLKLEKKINETEGKLAKANNDLSDNRMKKIEENAQNRIKELENDNRLLQEQASTQAKQVQPRVPQQHVKNQHPSDQDKYKPLLQLLHNFYEEHLSSTKKTYVNQNKLIFLHDRHDTIKKYLDHSKTLTNDELNKLVLDFMAGVMQKQKHYAGFFGKQTTTGAELFDSLKKNPALLKNIDYFKDFITIDSHAGRPTYRGFAHDVSNKLANRKQEVAAALHVKDDELTVSLYQHK